MNDTITALATPPGISGIAVIRISGPDSFYLIDEIFNGKKKISDCKSHTIHYGKIIYQNIMIDSVTVSIFREPHSYTGENVIEINCHGGILVSNEILNILIKLGARLAEPGEFTKRAFLSGKLDLTQVEAVADIIHSSSTVGFQTSARQLYGTFTTYINKIKSKLLDISSMLELELDFADEDLEFIDKNKIVKSINEVIEYCETLKNTYKASEIARSGFYVGIAGFPNSGKSTLFNKLIEKDRAIVSHIPGTTRDYIEETIYLKGLIIKIIDTAGIRETDDIIEIEGIKFVDSVLKQSNLIIVLNDYSISQNNSESLFKNIKDKYTESEVILVHNKIDKIYQVIKTELKNKDNTCYISAKQDTGITELKDIISKNAKKSLSQINDILLNKRQSILLEKAEEYLRIASHNLLNHFENEIISIDIRKSAEILGEICGDSWNEDVLNNIFSNFCIGK